MKKKELLWYKRIIHEIEFGWLPMQADVKTKLCWNCEGRVTHEEENCPFCGVYLSPTVSPTSSSDISPPYTFEEETDLAPPPPYGDKNTETMDNHINEAESKSINGESHAETNSNLSIILPLTACLAGSIFFLFGFILLLFSQNGVFSLSWNGDFWLAYLTFGFVMLLVGWKTLNRVEN